MPSRFWSIVGLPLAALLVLLSLYAVWHWLDLPPEETVIAIAQRYFETYGLLTVLVAAFIEGLLLIGWYFPGSLVIIFGLIFAGQDVPRVASVAALAAIGLLVAYVVNFMVGRHGWYRLLLAFGLRAPLANAQRRLTKYGLSAIFTTYWQANLSSVISTAAGVLQLSFPRFLAASFAAVAFWMTFWSTLIFFLGRAALTLAGFRFILLMILVWLILRFVYRRSIARTETAAP
jgi:membrane protein DedA with SNARE-associated domain